MVSDRTSRRPAPVPGPVALFIDWDNFAIGLRQEMPDRPPDLGPILRWARMAGTLIVSRAYGEWRDPSERLAIYNAGVEAVYAPVLPLGGSLVARNGAGGAKSLADTAMAVDVAEFLMLMPSITRLIMATSDKDLIPVVRLAQKRGVFAGVVGSDRTASALSDLADEFVTYRQLLEGEAPQPLAISRPVTVPPLRVTRGFRRPGEGLSVMSPSSHAMSRIAAPTVVVTTPSMPTQSTESSPDVALGHQLDDDTGAASRRRRRGGRRRRGAETLAIVGSDVSGDNDEQELAGRPPLEAPTVATQSVTQPSSRGAGLSDTVPVKASSPIARPIAAPMIAPRPFRTRASDGRSPLAGRPQPVLITPSFPEDPIGPVYGSDQATIDVATTQAEMQPAVAEPRTVGPAANPPSEPRVQLPGERLRRFVAPSVTTEVPPPPTTEVPPPQATLTSVEAVSTTASPGSESADEDHAIAEHGPIPPQASEVPQTAAQSTDEVVLEGDGADPTTAIVGTPRSRRRRGGRPVRGAGSSGDAESDPVVETAKASTVEEVREPAPNVDAVEASDSAPDGRPRGRRRGSRPRPTT